MPRRKTQEEFINEIQQVHKNKYDYSKVQYSNARTKIEVTCPRHGIFFPLPLNHLNGSGCPKCANEKKSMSREEFIQRATTKHHTEYDYSDVEYVNANTKVAIKCKTHGTFVQSPVKHLFGNGCPRCVGKYQTTQNFINKSIDVHGDKYDYSTSTYVTAHTKVIITCPEHGDFKMTPANHISHKQGCPNCSISKGELLIKQELINLGIQFSTQHRFENCINPITGYVLPFDFYIDEQKTLVEFDGVQHFRFTSKFHKTQKDLEYRKYLDNIKSSYAREHNFNLVRIPYTQINNINVILREIFID